MAGVEHLPREEPSLEMCAWGWGAAGLAGCGLGGTWELAPPSSFSSTRAGTWPGFLLLSPASGEAELLLGTFVVPLPCHPPWRPGREPSCPSSLWLASDPLPHSVALGRPLESLVLSFFICR